MGTDCGPALGTLNGDVFAAWKSSENHAIWFSQATFDAPPRNMFGVWTPQQQVFGVGTSAGPALAESGGRLYMAWRGESDPGIYWSSYDGIRWSPQRRISGAVTSGSPALADYNGTLYAAWRGESGDERIWWSALQGPDFGSPRLLGGLSSVGPDLVSGRGVLWAAWKGESGDSRQWYSWFDGTQWAPQRQIEGTWSSTGPALDQFSTRAVWKGEGSDTRIWTAVFGPQLFTPTADGTFGSQFVVDGTATDARPAIQFYIEAMHVLAYKGLDTGIYWDAYSIWSTPR